MSDDLVKRLRDTNGGWASDEAIAAADRIEELEAKLAKAALALDGMVGLFSADAILRRGAHVNMELYNARATLAELKGEDQR